MGHKIHKDKDNQGRMQSSLKDGFVLNDVLTEELDKRRIPVYSYLL